MKTIMNAMVMMTLASLSSCKTDESALNSVSQQSGGVSGYSFAVKMNPADSAQFMTILSKAGIKSSASGLGVNKFLVDEIYCGYGETGFATRIPRKLLRCFRA